MLGPNLPPLAERRHVIAVVFVPVFGATLCYGAFYAVVQ
jgi:hypothetical protein